MCAACWPAGLLERLPPQSSSPNAAQCWDRPQCTAAALNWKTEASLNCQRVLMGATHRRWQRFPSWETAGGGRINWGRRAHHHHYYCHHHHNRQHHYYCHHHHNRQHCQHLHHHLSIELLCEDFATRTSKCLHVSSVSYKGHRGFSSPPLRRGVKMVEISDTHAAQPREPQTRQHLPVHSTRLPQSRKITSLNLNYDNLALDKSSTGDFYFYNSRKSLAA